MIQITTTSHWTNLTTCLCNICFMFVQCEVVVIWIIWNHVEVPEFFFHLVKYFRLFFQWNWKCMGERTGFFNCDECVSDAYQTLIIRCDLKFFKLLRIGVCLECQTLSRCDLLESKLFIKLTNYMIIFQRFRPLW